MKHIAIIGGGASGLCCAVEVARHSENAKITIYEAASKIGKKLLVTGNGRCNMTNMNFSSEYYHGSVDFAMRIMKRFPPESNIEFFNSLGLYTKTDSCGRVYPMSEQATSVVDAFTAAVEKYNIRCVCETRITSIKRKGDGFLLNDTEYADCVVIASGGMVPMKKDDKCNSFVLLDSLSHSVSQLKPSLVQLVSDNKELKQLKGIRIDAELSLVQNSAVKKTERGELLFTDYGLSGIVSMQISSYLSELDIKQDDKVFVLVDLVPLMSEYDIYKAIESTASAFSDIAPVDVLCGVMPKKVGQAVVRSCLKSNITRYSQLTQKMKHLICNRAKHFEFDITGTRDFSFAQVTAGGAKTIEFSNTLQSKKVNGIFCCGEVLDVNGDCGGYNLQWAFASGRTAGISAALYASERQNKNDKNKRN